MERKPRREEKILESFTSLVTEFSNRFSMAPVSSWLRYWYRFLNYRSDRYFNCRSKYSINLFEKTHGRIKSMPSRLQLHQMTLETFLLGKLTFLHQNEAEELDPPTGINNGTFLVRRIPYAYPSNTCVGDMVVLKDPTNSQKYLLRRVAAIEGDEMVSTDEHDEPFVLGKNECWVLADDEATKPKGPVDMEDIVGRAIYVLKKDGEHGPVNNSRLSMIEDKPLLEVELDIEEMKNHNNN